MEVIDAFNEPCHDMTWSLDAEGPAAATLLEKHHDLQLASAGVRLHQVRSDRDLLNHTTHESMCIGL